jgi:DNA-binding CsgD family transcriptional regulator
MSLLATGEIAIQMGSYDRAREWLDESLVLARQDGDAFRIAHTFNALGDLYRLEQNYVEATNAYENGVALLRELGAQHDLASILSNLGYTYLHKGNVEGARSLFVESMSIHQTQQNKPGMAECLIGAAATAVRGGLPAAGARLLAAAAAISRQPSASQWRATQMEYERYLNLARLKLSPAEFQAEQTIGSSMSLEQAVTYAQVLVLKPGTPPVIAGTPNGLTGREREVAMLIGQGKSNSEIAAELVVSKRTVETHVSHILSKLGLSNRAHIMRWAIDHGLNQKPT